MIDLEPISFRLLLDRIVEPARRHLPRLLLPVAVPLAACGVLAAFLQMGWINTLMSGGDFSQVAPMIGGLFVMMMLVLASYLLGFSALVIGSLDAVGKRPIDMGRAWRFALEPRVFGTLVVIAVAGTLSVMMCFLPALYVVPLLTFVLPSMVEEDLYGWAAIRRSAQLAHYSPTGRWTESAWLQILVLLFVGMVINFAVTFAIQLPFLLVQEILMFRDVAAGQVTAPNTLVAGILWLQVPSQILGAFATVVTWLYWTFGISLLYREIRRRKEGTDLARAIEELTGATGRPSAPQQRQPAAEVPA